MSKCRSKNFCLDTISIISVERGAMFVLSFVVTATNTGSRERQLGVKLRKLLLLRALIFPQGFNLFKQISYGQLSNRSNMIVFKVYAFKLAILCKCEKVANVALIFRAFPGSDKLIYSFNIKFMTFYNQ